MVTRYRSVLPSDVLSLGWLSAVTKREGIDAIRCTPWTSGARDGGASPSLAADRRSGLRLDQRVGPLLCRCTSMGAAFLRGHRDAYGAGHGDLARSGRLSCVLGRLPPPPPLRHTRWPASTRT